MPGPEGTAVALYKLGVYVPQSHLEAVKSAMFAAGAGRIGHYDSCCWQVLGQGQFRPLAGSTPFMGAQDKVEQVAEYRVEMVVAAAEAAAVVQALKRAHPYEEPAWDMVTLVTEFSG